DIALDTVDGGTGSDSLVITTIGDVTLSANGNWVLLSNFFAAFDAAGVERVNSGSSAGADTITVNDLSGTGVTEVNVGLSNNGQPDNVIVNGTAGNDSISVAGDTGIVVKPKGVLLRPGFLSVSGLA